MYVCASHRVTFPGSTTEYANRLNADELRTIQNQYNHLGPLLTRSCFLTKLRKNFPIGEMTEDIILERAPNDDEFRQIRYSGLPSTEILLVAMVGVVVISSRIAGRRRRG